MSSILTNTSAMVALQTLKSINSGLEMTQSEISTGKSVASAKDNAAIWSIAKVMEADVSGFAAISDSLALGESTVAVAREAAESITDALNQVRDKIIAAQEDNVDRAKIQADIDSYASQIESFVASASFNGLNLVDGSVTDTNSNSQVGIDVLASMNRDSAGNVTPAYIGVDATNLSLTGGTALNAAAFSVTAGGTTDPGTAGVIDAFDGGTNDSITLDVFAFLDTSGTATGTSAVLPSAPGVDTANNDGLVVGDEVSLTVGNYTGSYIIQEGDIADSIVGGLKNALQASGLDTNDYAISVATGGELTITNNTNSDISFSTSATRGSGGLSDLSTIDVSTSAGADAALLEIESMIQTAIDAAAAFGTAENRIELQNEFVGKLSDKLEAGIGSMVDADMEEASARLQALQTQQQLGIQALSIANSAPQNILRLFQ